MEGVREPAPVQTLRGHRSEVTCVDAAGALAVSGGGDCALRLWRWRAARGWREAACAAAAHRYGVTAARLAPGGALLASGGVDGAVRVWAARSLAARAALAAPGGAAVRALCWAGRRVLAGHGDGALRVWDAPRATLLARLHAHTGALHAVAAPARHALLLTACTDGVLKVFDLAEVCRSGSSEGEGPAPLTWVDSAHDLGALCADASEAGDAATGGQDALVRVWRVAARGLAAQCALAGHGAAVTAVRWARGAALLGSASLDRTARLWAMGAAPACLHVLHAHARYLTCISFAPDQRYILTGSNDKSVKMWSLSNLTLEDELETPCVVLDHFALGDLEGIGPLEESLSDLTLEVDEGAESGAQPLWHATEAHSGPINSIAIHGDMVATASSDGWVRLYRWCETRGALLAVHALAAHQYPAMAVDFGSNGALLLSAGLDGRACLWDVQSGVQLRVLSAGADKTGGAAGGGGVRGARVSPRRPARLLLATDDGVAPLWTLECADPRPVHVFVAAGLAEAVTCCAWASDARAAATGAAGGELRLLAPPPRAALLHHEPDAHDLGVQSCDFAPNSADFELPEHTHLLASAGSDSIIKLWIVELQQEEGEVVGAAMRLAQRVEAHGGGATCVRWGRGGVLASAGADGWARAWSVAPRSLDTRVAGSAGPGAGALLAAALLPRAAPLLVVGSLAGQLSVWRLPRAADPLDEDEAAPPCLWGPAGVTRWIYENVTRAPGAQVSPEEEAELRRRVREFNITGSRLVSAPVDELLKELGYGDTLLLEDFNKECLATRERIQDELSWLRRKPPTSALEAAAPHELLCPLSHRLLAEPVRAADGYTYERANILDWFIAADGAVSPISAQRLRNAHVQPNYKLRDCVRQFLRDHYKECEHESD